MAKTITIKEFAAERGVSYNTITQFLYRQRRNKAINGVKTEPLPKIDGVIVLEKDSAIYKILDVKYPEPRKPVEVVQSEELLNAYKKIAELQGENSKLQVQALQAQFLQQQIEQAQADKTAAIAEKNAYFEDSIRAKVQAEEAVKRAESAEERARAAEERAKEAEEQISNMKKAGLWQRILKKW